MLLLVIFTAVYNFVGLREIYGYLTNKENLDGTVALNAQQFGVVFKPKSTKSSLQQERAFYENYKNNIDDSNSENASSQNSDVLDLNYGVFKPIATNCAERPLPEGLPACVNDFSQCQQGTGLFA